MIDMMSVYSCRVTNTFPIDTFSLSHPLTFNLAHSFRDKSFDGRTLRFQAFPFPFPPRLPYGRRNRTPISRLSIQQVAQSRQLLSYGLVAVYTSRKCIYLLFGWLVFLFRVESVLNLHIWPRVNFQRCTHAAARRFCSVICNAEAALVISTVAISTRRAAARLYPYFCLEESFSRVTTRVTFETSFVECRHVSFDLVISLLDKDALNLYMYPHEYNIFAVLFHTDSSCMISCMHCQF